LNSQQIYSLDFSGELTFTASRSSGPGGQNVNKVSTKVELRFNIGQSKVLTEEEKELIREKAAKKINQEDELIIVCQSERTQLKNREKTIEKFYALLEKALIPKKKRKPTKVPQEMTEKRLELKRLRAEKKELRKRIN
jgi:ribosome-associated protein